MKTIFRSLVDFISNQKVQIKYGHIYSRIFSAILIMAILNLTTGCHPYYRSTTVVKSNTNPRRASYQINKFRNEDKYYVVHQGEKMWHLQDASVNKKDKTLKGIFEEVDSVHMHYITLMKQSKKASYEKINKGDVLSQVHLYVTEYAQEENSRIVISFSSIKQVDFYYQPKGPITIGIMIPAAIVTFIFFTTVIIGYVD